MFVGRIVSVKAGEIARLDKIENCMPTKSESRESNLTASQWRQIVNSATDTAIISTDENGSVTSWNSGAERIFGWTEREMLGQPLTRIFTEADHARNLLDKEMIEARDHGRGGGEEGWRLRKDGSRFWAVGELSPIRNNAGDIVGFTKIVRDRTVQQAAEEAAWEERQALEILNRAGSALAVENDVKHLVQIVTDAGVELSRAQFGAFFYNLINEAGESYMLYTLSGAPMEAFSKFPMPRNTNIFAPTFHGEGIVRSADITKDPRYGHNSPRKGMPEGHLPVRSYLAVPVISRSGDVLGGLFFGHEERGVFSGGSGGGVGGLAAGAGVGVGEGRLCDAALRVICVRSRGVVAR
jgi:PAS domain S-box-containing protein